MDEVTWTALAAVLTLLGLAWTVVGFRRRGAANGLRALGVTLLVPAAWLTGSLEMLTEVGSSVLDWATSLVLDPRVWAGTALAGLSVVLLVVSGILRDRQLGRGRAAVAGGSEPRRLGAGRAEQPRRSTGDPELDEIEELLRRRGVE